MKRPLKIDAFDGTKYDFLSNFHPSLIVWQGLSYPTVEHAYQAAKTLDTAASERIRLARSPGTAKRLGQSVKLRSDWESVKIQVMHDLVREKFLTSATLRKKLLATGDAELIEGNTWNDTFWGVCKGVGRNELGKVLMKVRAELPAEVT